MSCLKRIFKSFAVHKNCCISFESKSFNVAKFFPTKELNIKLKKKKIKKLNISWRNNDNNNKKNINKNKFDYKFLRKIHAFHTRIGRIIFKIIIQVKILKTSQAKPER